VKVSINADENHTGVRLYGNISLQFLNLLQHNIEMMRTNIAIDYGFSKPILSSLISTSYSIIIIGKGV